MLARLERMSEARERMLRRRRAVVGGSVALVLLAAGGGYVASAANAPLTAAEVAFTVDTHEVFTVDPALAQSVADSQYLPTAIGWADTDLVWSNANTPVPLASLSKLVTMLVCLERMPLEAGSDGPTIVWNEQDVATQELYAADLAIVYPIPVGTEVTLRQLITLSLLPSASDFAAAYVNHAFDTTDDFYAEVGAWSERHGISSLSFVDPTGMDAGNRAAPADIWRIANLALENPTIAEFISMPSAELPWGIGIVENTNPLLGTMPGVIGVKTGTWFDFGYNLAVAQEIEVEGRELVSLSVTLGRENSAAQAGSGRVMLDELASLPSLVSFVAADQVLGSVTTVDGQYVDLVVDEPLQAVMLPGETAERTITIDLPGVSTAGTRAGTVNVASPTGDVSVPIFTSAEITEPGLWWRITHPATVFGWG